MKTRDIKKKAMAMGLKVSGAKRADLIRMIQTAEGNTPCFDTGVSDCDQMGCCWRPDCQPKGDANCDQRVARSG